MRAGPDPIPPGIARGVRSAGAALRVLVALSAVAGGRPAAAGPEGFAFEPGVIVDPGRGAVYLMRPDSGIDAVDLVSGRRLWRTDRAAKPLLLGGDRLLAQAEPAGDTPLLRLALLDVGDGSREERMIDIPLPPGVEPRIAEGMESSFTLDARQEDGDIVVGWSETRRRATGTPSPDAGTTVSGRARIDPVGGEVERLGTREPAPPGPGLPAPLRRLEASGALTGPLRRVGDAWVAVERTASDRGQRVALRRWNATGEPRPDQLLFDGGMSFRSLSADGRHLLASRRDPADPASWAWAIFSLADGQRVAAVRSDVPGARFFVHDARLVLLVEARVGPPGDAVRMEPPRLRAIDLETGAEVWSHPFRDTRYRGPLPPADSP